MLENVMKRMLSFLLAAAMVFWMLVSLSSSSVEDIGGIDPYIKSIT